MLAKFNICDWKKLDHDSTHCHVLVNMPSTHTHTLIDKMKADISILSSMTNIQIFKYIIFSVEA